MPLENLQHAMRMKLSSTAVRHEICQKKLDAFGFFSLSIIYTMGQFLWFAPVLVASIKISTTQKQAFCRPQRLANLTKNAKTMKNKIIKRRRLDWSGNSDVSGLCAILRAYLVGSIFFHRRAISIQQLITLNIKSEYFIGF